VKKLLTIVLAWASLALMFTFVAAGSFRGNPNGDAVTEADALPAYEIVATVRSMGLRPSGEPERQGPYYVLHATDARGTELRVVADAKFGDILSVAPVANASLPRYQRGPHIIQVPQPGARANTQTIVNNRGEPDAVDDADDDQAVPPPRRLGPEYPSPKPEQKREPRWQPRSETTPAPAPKQPPQPRRAVLSAPAEGPTPIRPTPRFSAKPDPAGKFGQENDTRSNAPPPPGYTPPNAVPHED
jgi:hypothetical protein